jgi:hypothetical protein
MPDNANSSLNESGTGADQSFPDSQAGASVQECQKKTWVAIELKDTDGKPVAGESYRLELPDGRVIEGTLDENGQAGVKGIDPGPCRVCFPDLDASEWKPA